MVWGLQISTGRVSNLTSRTGTGQGRGQGRDREWGQDGNGTVTRTRRKGDGTANEQYSGLWRVGTVWGRGERRGHERDGDRDRVVDGHAYDGLLDNHASRLSQTLWSYRCANLWSACVEHLLEIGLAVLSVNCRMCLKNRVRFELSVCKNLFQRHDDL